MSETLTRAVFLIYYSYLLILYFRTVTGWSIYPTAATLFLVWQSLAFFSTLVQKDSWNWDVADTRLLMISAGMTLFVIGAAIANRTQRFHPRTAIQQFRNSAIYFDVHSGVLTWVVLGIGAVSTVVSLLFLQRLGSSVVFDSLSTYLSTGNLIDSSFVYSTGRRLVHGNRDVYLGSGYSFQFLAVLLPATVYLLLARAELLNRRRDLVILLAFTAITVFALLIPGNRSIVLNFFLVFTLILTPRWGPLGRHAKPRRWIWFVPLTGLALFAVISTLGGRSGQVTTIGNAVTSSMADLFDRALILPSSAQLLFLRIFDGEVLRWGKGWWDSLKILLPGTPDSSLASTLSYLVSGDAGGSAPPDYWNSIYWNFDWVGILLVPLVTGYLFQRLTIFYFTGRRTLSKIVILYASFFTLYQITDPIDYFNLGFVTLMVLFGLVVLVKRLEVGLHPALQYDIEIPPPIQTSAVTKPRWEKRLTKHERARFSEGKGRI
jgi:hypothetical protein